MEDDRIKALDALGNNTRWYGEREREEEKGGLYLKDIRVLPGCAMHTDAFPPPIHWRDGGGCCDPLPSPGINHHPRARDPLLRVLFKREDH